MKRTPLKRRTPLRAAAQLVARKQTKRNTRREGVPADTRVLLWARSKGRCEVCEIDLTGPVPVPISAHHRLPRQAGGDRRPDVHSPANLLLLCGTGTTGCHGDIERNRSWAYERGYLVHRGLEPAEVPVRMHGRTWLLLPDGSLREVAT